MSNIKIVAVITVKPEHRQTLLAVFQQLVAASRQESGNVRYDLHQAIDNENRLVFVENWQDQAALDEHNASPHFQSFLQAIEDRTEAVEIILMQDVSADNAI